MASTINADNGVVSGTSGLKSTADTSGVLALQSNGSTGVTLDTSLNVGVGTTSPVARLTSKASANTYSGGSLALQAAVSGTSYLTNAGGVFYISNDGSTDQFVLNASGNLGLGVTPSAWGSNYKAMQFGAQGSIHTYVGVSMSMAANAYDSGAGAWKYIANNYACRFTQDPSNGQSVWQNAPLGTAGAALTWTTSLSINNSGAIGVGSSPSYGTSGQVLTSGGSGAAPTWSTPSSGAMVYISTTTASNSATIDITGLSSTYSQYVIIVEGFKPDTSYTGILCRFQYNGSWLTTSYAYSFVQSTGSGGNSPDIGQIALCGNVMGSNYATYFTVNFPTPSATSINKSIYWSGVFTVTDGSSFQMTGGGTQWNSTALAVTGIRFYTNSGNITAGRFRLYGIVGS